MAEWLLFDKIPQRRRTLSFVNYIQNTSDLLPRHKQNDTNFDLSQLDTLGSLGINTKFASAFEARILRFSRQAAARVLMTGDRVSWCLRELIPGKNTVDLWYSDLAKRAHYKNLVVCGGLWVCPVCAAKITERRRIELSHALDLWPGSVFMATITFQHSRDDKLSELRDYLNQAYRSVKSGRKWQGIISEFCISGSVAGTEVTWGFSSGWHIHKHVLFFSSSPSFDKNKFQSGLYQLFSSALDKLGRYVSPLHGIKVTEPNNAKSYAAKWGLDAELAKAPVKNSITGFSPFQLLDLFMSGHSFAGDLYREYGSAMHGAKQLVWTKGLRNILGLGQDKTDCELATEIDQESIILASLNLDDWRLILANDARAELLEIASTGNAQNVINFLGRLKKG